MSGALIAPLERRYRRSETFRNAPDKTAKIPLRQWLKPGMKRTTAGRRRMSCWRRGRSGNDALHGPDHGNQAIGLVASLILRFHQDGMPI